MPTEQNHLRWIVETGVLLALLIVVQWFTKPFGPLLTGTAVNFALIAAALIGGIVSGVVVGIISPFLALLVGIVPLPVYIVPVVAAGNVVIVVIYGLLLKKAAGKGKQIKYTLWALTVVCGALLKFFVLYAGVNWLVMPLVTNVTGAAAKVPAAVFSTSQIITAVVGGLLALLIVPRVRWAIRKNATFFQY